MEFIRDTKVKQFAKSWGFRTSKDYLIWLDEQVRKMVDRHVALTRGTKTLNSKDASAIEELKK